VIYTNQIGKVRSLFLFKDGKQTAGCTENRTETGLRSLVSVQKFVHPAVCLPSLKRERTLVRIAYSNDDNSATVSKLTAQGSHDRQTTDLLVLAALVLSGL